MSVDTLMAMRTFATVVDSGSFTRAAERLATPKSRISQRISALEAHLGVRLLQRSTRALRLTEDGERYHARCVELLASLDELEHGMRGTHGQPAGTLRLEVVVPVAKWIVIPALPDFLARYPQLRVHLGTSDRLAHLIEEGIDCAIRGGPLAQSGLVFRPLCEVHFGLYAAPAWLRRHGTPDAPATLERSTRLGVFDHQTGEAQVWRLQRGAETIELRGEPQVRFDDGEMALTACLNGAGITLAPPFAALPHIRRGDLVPLLPEWSGGTRPLQIVTPSRRHMPARVRAFIDWMLARVARDPSLTAHPSALEALLPRG